MLNAFQFSAAKTAAEGQLLQEALFDEDKNRKGYSEFKADAKAITDIVQETWLRTEYDLLVKNTVQGELFNQMVDDKDLYPYWVYLETDSAHPREDHLELVGRVFRIGDPEGDDCFPSNGYNCGCGSEAIDDDTVAERGLTVLTNEQAGALRNKEIDENFRYNPGVQGAFPNDSSYAQVLGSANEANYKNFDLGDGEDNEDMVGLSSALLAAKGLHAMLNIIGEWRTKYHHDNKGQVIFQNKDTLTNVVFTNQSLHQIQKHDKGFEYLPKAITSPNEIWMSWGDAKQRVVLRNYILFGKISYVVQTRDGVITDAFAVTKKGANKFRRGVVI
jgi:hypothetical protein